MRGTMIPALPEAVFAVGKFVYTRQFLHIAHSILDNTPSLIEMLIAGHPNSARLLTGVLILQSKDAFIEFERSVGQFVRQHASELSIRSGLLHERIRLGGAALDASPIFQRPCRTFFHSWGEAFEEQDGHLRLKVDWHWGPTTHYSIHLCFDDKAQTDLSELAAARLNVALGELALSGNESSVEITNNVKGRTTSLRFESEPLQFEDACVIFAELIDLCGQNAGIREIEFVGVS